MGSSWLRFACVWHNLEILDQVRIYYNTCWRFHKNPHLANIKIYRSLAFKIPWEAPCGTQDVIQRYSRLLSIILSWRCRSWPHLKLTNHQYILPIGPIHGCEGNTERSGLVQPTYKHVCNINVCVYSSIRSWSSLSCVIRFIFSFLCMIYYVNYHLKWKLELNTYELGWGLQIVT